MWTVVLGSLEGKSGLLCGEERWVGWSAIWCAGVVDVCLSVERVSHSFVVDVEENAVDWDKGRVAVEVLLVEEGSIVGFPASQ